MGEEGEAIGGGLMSNKVQLKDALAIGIRKRFLTVNEDEHVMATGGEGKHVKFQVNDQDDQGNSSGLQKFSENIIVKNMLE